MKLVKKEKPSLKLKSAGVPPVKGGLKFTPKFEPVKVVKLADLEEEGRYAITCDFQMAAKTKVLDAHQLIHDWKTHKPVLSEPYSTEKLRSMGSFHKGTSNIVVEFPGGKHAIVQRVEDSYKKLSTRKLNELFGWG